ncbi:MAG TPA: 2-aminoethylphosphonate--pyruvate transaminase [Verrucomicrobiae bacterium]|jgi:2-aminoethylphosphonate-pyruvate transaminase|nr:2-aminoethylphosphonate--pyruvate transaminase [Verrucomicrobiae bacterium]
MTAHDKLLFTPGPLTLSLSVKLAMLHDAGSWHNDFNGLVASLREQLLALSGLSRENGWEAVLMQGSGTFAVESVFQTCVPNSGKVAVLANGAYGERIVQMLAAARIPHVALRCAEDTVPDPAALAALLASDGAITHVAMVHCETTTGILNPIETIGPLAKAHGKIFIVDAMSTFAALPIDFAECGIDLLVSSANKCLEGAPGIGFVIGRRGVLLANEGGARSLSLDVAAQLRGFEKDGKFRFTPPTHILLALAQAMRELEAEGGLCARLQRYRANHNLLVSGMRRLGFQPYLRPEVQGPIITSFLYPHDKFDFTALYNALSERGFIIYPGKLTQANTFRIGNIGWIYPADIEQLLAAIENVIWPVP